MTQLFNIAAKLTDSELTDCLHEMRKRGWAVIAYDVAELGEGPLMDENGEYDAARVKTFLADHREYLEDAMCKGVWDYCENEDAMA